VKVWLSVRTGGLYARFFVAGRNNREKGLLQKGMGFGVAARNR